MFPIERTHWCFPWAVLCWPTSVGSLVAVAYKAMGPQRVTHLAAIGGCMEDAATRGSIDFIRVGARCVRLLCLVRPPKRRSTTNALVLYMSCRCSLGLESAWHSSMSREGVVLPHVAVLVYITFRCHVLQNRLLSSWLPYIHPPYIIVYPDTKEIRPAST
jgi:hypothetical protein